MRRVVHPVIRIVVFLVVASFLASGQYFAMLLSAAALTFLILRSSIAVHRAALQMLRRMRWLLLSMLIVYGWFTPGEALWPALGAATPTVAGLLEGLQRAAALVLMALAAQQLISGLAPPQLLAALLWLSKPLQVFGLARERLALRLMLTLEAVPRLTRLMTADLYAGLTGNVVSRFGQIAARAFCCALQQADQQVGRTVDRVDASRPPWYQWLYPLALTGVLSVMH